MTIRFRCVRCDHVIEASDAMAGQETVCPGCEATNVLRAPEEEAVEAARREAEHRRFLDGLARRPRNGDGWQAPIETLAAGDLATLAAHRLKDISVYLLVFAYLIPLLPLGAGTVLLAGDLPWWWKTFAFLSGLLAGALIYLFFKFMSDVIRAQADLTDLGRSIEHRLAQVEQELLSAPPGADAHGEPPVGAARAGRG